MKRAVRSVARIARALALAAVAACGDGPLGAERTANVRVHANLVGTPVHTLVIQVTGPGIVDPVVFNLAAVNGAASGTITVPVGSDRTITVRAYDLGGVETHRGEQTLDVHAGTSPTLTFTLLPLRGDLPITITLGAITVSVSPGASMYVGGAAQFEATVLDGQGNPMDVQVAWATLHPIRTTIDSTGRLYARDTGSVTVVATYGGVAASTTFEVTAPEMNEGARMWVGGTLGVQGAWDVASNWWPRGKPVETDSIVVYNRAPWQPVLAADAAIGALYVEAGATLTTGDYDLEVTGTVISEGWVASNYGAWLRTTGGAATVRGNFTHLNVASPITLSGPTLVGGDLGIDNAGTSLTLGGNRVNVSGILFVMEQATLVMQDAADTLDVAGAIYFGVTVPHDSLLTAGVLRTASDFYEYGGFGASGSHVLEFDGIVGQTVYGNFTANEVRVTGAGNVAIGSPTINGALRMLSPVALTGGTVNAHGVVQTIAGSTLMPTVLRLHHAAALDSAAGGINIPQTEFVGTSQKLGRRPYDYVIVRPGATVTAADSVTVFDLWIEGALAVNADVEVVATQAAQIAFGGALANDGHVASAFCQNLGGTYSGSGTFACDSGSLSNLFEAGAAVRAPVRSTPQSRLPDAAPRRPAPRRTPPR